MHLPTLLLPLLLVLTTASPLTISIPPSPLLPIPNSLPASTHATLTSLSPANHPSAYPLTAPLTRASTFVFPDLQPPAAHPESFLLDIRAAQFVFAPLRVDVSADGRVVGVWETVPGTPWENRGVERFAADDREGRGRDGDGVNVEAKVVGRREFYQERTQFSPLSLLKNPMILIGVAALVFAFGMPKIMQNMDPELRAEFEKHSSASPITGASRQAMGAGGGPNFDLAGWMAGTAPGPMASVGSAAEEVSGRDAGAGAGAGAGAARRR